jgi:hypothetical protein
MTNIYLVIAKGFNKDGKPYSKLGKVVEYTKDGKTMAFIDTKSPQYTDKVLEIGAKVQGNFAVN